MTKRKVITYQIYLPIRGHHPSTGGWYCEEPKAEAEAIINATACPAINRELFVRAVIRAIMDYRETVAMRRADPSAQDVRSTLHALAEIEETAPIRDILFALDATTECLLDEEAYKRTGSFLHNVGEMSVGRIRELAAAALNNHQKHPGGRPRKPEARWLVKALAAIFKTFVGEPTVYDNGPFARFVKEVFTVAYKPNRPPTSLFRHYIIPALKTRDPS